MERWEVPAATYAVFRCTLNTLRQTFDYAYQEWLPNSPYERAPSPEFEYYGADYDPQNDDSPMSVFIPITPRKG